MAQKGGRGFPGLMFLNAEGQKLAVYRGPRSVAGFERALVEVEALVDLEKRALAGDAEAATDWLIHGLRLEWYGFAEAKAKVAALAAVTPAQRETIDRLLVDAEVRSLVAEASGGKARRVSVERELFGMWKAGRVPAGEDAAYGFWSLIADYAERRRDKELFRKVLQEFGGALGGNPMYRAAQRRLEQRLASFPEK